MHEKPISYENDLSDFKPCIFDSGCGECIGWGFEIIHHLGDERFDALRQFGDLRCVYPTWYLITKTLSREEAIQKYGNITKEEFGPRGGYKSVTFGEKLFLSKHMKKG